MFLVQLDKQSRIFLEFRILQCMQDDVVVSFNDVITTAHCDLNIESTQPVPF